jgi:DNA-binding HxlR family transcriptional regulator
MRSYKQHCGLAKALDIVGDRWTLLIVRELLIRDACRYTDLQNGLPGIATNLLAERLRELEAAAIVVREDAPPPIATTLFRLTARGKALEPAILALGLWGAPLLSGGTRGIATQPHWIVLPLKIFLKDRRPDGPDAGIEVRAGKEAITIALSGGSVDVRLGAPARADAVVTGKPDRLLEFFSGRLDGDAAKAAGIDWRGAREVLARVVPSISRAT